MIFDLQKASFLKRISAWLLDVILLMVLVVGFGFLISSVTGYDNYNNRLESIMNDYADQYGISNDISFEEFEKLTPEEKQQYEAADEAVGKDPEAKRLYNIVLNLTMVIVTLSFLLAHLVINFVVPLFLKNGQTLGKKIFSIAVMRVDSVRVSPFLLFVRTFLGKYTVETMIPVLIVLMWFFNIGSRFGTLIIGFILLFNIISVCATKTNSMLHDLLSQTVVVDMSTQLIFGSKEEMIAAKEAYYAEQAEKQAY